jgi:hypothetical protein
MLDKYTKDFKAEAKKKKSNVKRLAIINAEALVGRPRGCRRVLALFAAQ